MWDDVAFANYIVGFAEGESTFSLSITFSRRAKFGIFVRPRWEIVQVGNDDLLKELKSFLGVGHIYQQKRKTYSDSYKHRDSAVLSVEGKKCLRIVEFFEKFPLRGKKAKDFEFWKKIVHIYVYRQHSRDNAWVKEDLVAILGLKRQMDQVLMRPKTHPKGAIAALELLSAEF